MNRCVSSPPLQDFRNIFTWIFTHSSSKNILKRQKVHLINDVYNFIFPSFFFYRNGQTIAIKIINKISFALDKRIRKEVKQVR